jgi:tRNA pseudouridine38-40 synthase
MRKSAAHLIGTHDFSSFRGAGCQAKTPVRTIEKLELFQKETFIIMDITANAFLLHMVRNIVGVLLEVGMQRQPADWVKSVLLAKDRQKASITAPAKGLYLMKVDYEPDYVFPKSSLNIFNFL